MAGQEITIVKRILWTIPKCSKAYFQSQKTGVVSKSPSFEIAIDDNITNWCLSFYCNGETANDESHVSFFAHKLSSDSNDFSGSFKMGILGRTEADDFMTDWYEISPVAPDDGFTDLIHHDDLFDSRKFIVKGNMTLVCELELVGEKTPDVTSFYPLDILTDFQKMFDNELFTDFKLKTNDGKVLKANKAILSVRSPVFQAMLANDMQEVKKGFANVPDFDSLIMKEVLRFIYCNRVNNIKEIARDLIYAAEKYEINGLKQMCIDIIIGSLSKVNVVEALVISDHVSEARKLYKKCIDMIIKNYYSIIQSKEWKNLSNEMIIKVQHEKISRLDKVIYL